LADGGVGESLGDHDMYRYISIWHIAFLEIQSWDVRVAISIKGQKNPYSRKAESCNAFTGK
jgi:hypothetical protein